MAGQQSSFEIVNEIPKKVNKTRKSRPARGFAPKFVVSKQSARQNARRQLSSAGKHLSNLPRVHGHNSKLPRLVKANNEKQQPLSDEPEIDEFAGDVEEPDSAADSGTDVGLLDDNDGPHDGGGGIHSGFGDDERISPVPEVPPKLVTYQLNKISAQGISDLALFSANVNQLRNLLDSSNTHPYYYFNLTLIAASIILQIAVGVGIIMNNFYKVIKKDTYKAGIINDMTVVGVYLITILNVFITSFGMATSL
ncbi:uncharacterized protein LOC115455012 [Manduca sexta]|uniref:uncharacterized protein LOC115455012 n=1 Tax=Manduca sexta TaxID=7130 RepID=UPI00188FC22B|nr:uncharacterized protein LOC115455012 [Manduca sexta]